MRRESRESRAAGGSRLERAIVMQLLRDDRDHEWSPANLHEELDADAAVVAQALSSLAADGVLIMADERVWAARAVWRLEELGLIAL
jgi:hypothetical protein